MSVDALSDKDLLDLFARRCAGMSCGEFDNADLEAEILRRMGDLNS